MATNKDGQYVYQKGDGFGGFLLDLFTPDAANVKQRNQTVRRVTGSVTGVVDNYVNTAGSVLKTGIRSVPQTVAAVAPALPAIAGAAAPFVGGVGGAILGALGSTGAAVPPPVPAPAPVAQESSNTGLWLGLGLLGVGLFSMRGDKK